MIYMAFDVESVGLHGEGYAVAWSIVDGTGKRVMESCHACDPGKAGGDQAGREWVAANAPEPFSGFNCDSPRQVRDEFWRAWLIAKEHGAVLIADCCWPVEARFLAACIDDDPAGRYWQGPYPLHDVASVRMAAGLDPLGVVDRLPDETPVHDPLADARQSARLFLEALKLCGKVDYPGPEPPP